MRPPFRGASFLLEMFIFHISTAQTEYPFGVNWIFIHVSPWVLGTHLELPVKSFICVLVQLVGTQLPFHD